MASRIAQLHQLLSAPSRYQAAIDAASTPQLAASTAQLPRQRGISSPLSDQSALQAVVWADLTDQTANLLTREAALSIPALARQRHIIAGSIARCPLVVVDAATGTPIPEQPIWLSRTDRLVSPYHRTLWTVDDQLFDGWALWRCERGYGGALLGVEHIAYERWGTDDAGRIEVDGELVADGEVIALPGPHPGILHFGASALRRTLDNLDAAANAARNPSAYLELHYEGDDELTDDQIDALIERWAKARRGLNGGVSYTNKYLRVIEHGTHESHLLVEGRNADAVDVSRMVSSPAAMADATNAGASLTYETTAGRNAELIDYGIGLYLDSIAARLSLDDVVPRGQRVVFDTSELRTVAPSSTDTDAAGVASTPAPAAPAPEGAQA